MAWDEWEQLKGEALQRQQSSARMQLNQLPGDQVATRRATWLSIRATLPRSVTPRTSCTRRSLTTATTPG